VSGPGLIDKGCLEEGSQGDVKATVTVDVNDKQQIMEGFGAAMTESSAHLIYYHPKKQEVI